MSYCFLCLGHNIVVGSHDNDGNIRHLCTAGTHGRKCLMSGRVEERHVATVVERHIVGTNVLRDASRLSGDDVRVTDIVQQTRLSVIHVSHHRYDGCTRNQIGFIVVLLRDSLADFGAHIFRLEAKFLGHEVDGLSIHALIYTYHNADAHASGYNLRHWHVHHSSQLVCRHELRQLQDLAVGRRLLHLFLQSGAYGIAFLAAVLGAFSHLIVLAGQTGQRFANMLCHFFVAHLWSQRTLLGLILLLLLASRGCSLSFPFSTLLLAGNGSHIHTFLAQTHTLLAVACLALLGLAGMKGAIFVFSLAALLLAALFLRTRALIDAIQVDVSLHRKAGSCLDGR